MTTVAPGDIQQAFVDAVGAENVTLDVDGYSVDGLAPSLIVRPSDIHQLSRAMAVAAERRLAVAPRGGGTRMEVGNPPERLDAVVEVSRLDDVIEHNPADLTVTTQTGITVSSLRRVLEKEGQLLAIDPPLPDRATIGGTLASGADGPLRWHYGHPRDSVIGMRVVQADGTITKSGGQVVKNVSGYDMSRLHVGGLGTLGVIAEVSFKLTPLPQRQATLLGGFESVEAALDAGLGIFHSQVMPLALTVFDDTVRRPSRIRSAGVESPAGRQAGGDGREASGVRSQNAPRSAGRTEQTASWRSKAMTQHPCGAPWPTSAGTRRRRRWWSGPDSCPSRYAASWTGCARRETPFHRLLSWRSQGSVWSTWSGTLTASTLRSIERC